MHNLKYHGDQKTGHLSVLLPELEWKIVPVPIHPSKLKKRGFNQTEVIAKGMLIDKRYKIELEAITRAEKGTSLTKLDRNERSTLTESLYQLHPEEKIQGANVILLDDVLTTGATLTRCAQLLRKSKVCTLAFSEK
ncbi:MAG: ComF family protein [Flavobacteriales bacterium]